MASSSVGMSYTLAGLAVTVAIGGSVARAQPMAQPDSAGSGDRDATCSARRGARRRCDPSRRRSRARAHHLGRRGVVAHRRQRPRLRGRLRDRVRGDGLDRARVAALRSDIWGAYAGVRYRFLTGWLRPYAAVGIPMFFFTDDAGASTAAFGVRGAAGLELMLSSHFSVEAISASSTSSTSATRWSWAKHSKRRSSCRRWP